MSERCSSYAENEPGARPIRMRGYYRAVTRGVEWAVKIDQIKEPLQKSLALLYRCVDFKKLFSEPNPFLKNLPKVNPFPGVIYITLKTPTYLRMRSYYRAKRRDKMCGSFKKLVGFNEP